MKALIWIIVLIIIGWGIWWFVNRGDDVANNQPAAAGQGLDINADASVSGDNSTDDGALYDDKG